MVLRVGGVLNWLRSSDPEQVHDQMATPNMNALGHPKLQPKYPVPSDIQVSQDIVKEIGLLSIRDLAKE